MKNLDKCANYSFANMSFYSNSVGTESKYDCHESQYVKT